mmetsp:Transcript_39600/g.38148  ORF Transcript_39600/g.38148 Transcript_39600/m.38148 type:complete len:217 (+) Transcript_39600:970-1620(+)
MPTEVQEDIEVPTLSDGQPNLVYTLYSEDGLVQYDGNKDVDNVISSLEEYETVTERFFDTYTPNIKVLIPEGLRDVLSIDTEVTAKVCVGDNDDTSGSSCSFPFISTVRGMATKIPGYTFSSYKQIAFFATILISQKQYADILAGLMANNTEMQTNFENLIAGYNFTDDVPKRSLYINLNSNITQSRRNYIDNGLKAYFNSQTTVLVDSQQVLTSI